MHDAEHSTEQPQTANSGEAQNARPEFQHLAAELETQKKAFAELNDQLLRLAADFENFKKRSARERESYISLANERFAIDILEVVDNFERALKADDTHLREGIFQIQQLLNTTVTAQWYNSPGCTEKAIQSRRT